MFASILAYLSGLVSLLILDGIMIYLVILPTFKKYIPSYLNTDMNYMAAILFYLLYILILFVLVVFPGIESKISIFQIFYKSVLFGFGAYMTYELTSMSVIKGWSWNMVVVDLLWGTLVTAIIGVVMYKIYNFFI